VTAGDQRASGSAARPALPLAGQVALVTGAAGGIGRATTLRLARDGAIVGGLDRDGDRLVALEQAAVQAGLAERVMALEGDVTDPAAVISLVAALVHRHGQVTILVNNAGIAGTGPFLTVTDAAWAAVVAVHVDGARHATRAVLPAMLEAGRGRIVTVLTDGLWHGRTSVPYTSAKGALLGFTRSLAQEVAAAGVRVNAVAPGPVETAMLLDGDPDEIEAERRTVPIGRILTPGEVAGTIAFLCGPDAEPYVGQVLSPNGGTVLAG